MSHWQCGSQMSNKCRKPSQRPHFGPFSSFACSEALSEFRQHCQYLLQLYEKRWGCFCGESGRAGARHGGGAAMGRPAHVSPSVQSAPVPSRKPLAQSPRAADRTAGVSLCLGAAVAQGRCGRDAGCGAVPLPGAAGPGAPRDCMELCLLCRWPDAQERESSSSLTRQLCQDSNSLLALGRAELTSEVSLLRWVFESLSPTFFLFYLPPCYSLCSCWSPMFLSKLLISSKISKSHP